MNSKSKNIRDLYRGINGDLLADSDKNWIGGRTASLSYRIYLGSVILGR
jgi:hypothetical protein